MITLTFPDGASREFPKGISGLDVAQGIAPSLAKKSMCMVLNGEMVDLKDTIEADARIEFVTRSDERALELIRHDCAHVLAEAVQTLFPGTQVTIGPVIENGFFYDFHREKPFTPDELPLIEAKMREIIARNAPFSKEVWSRDEAKAYFKAKGEHFKVELVDAIPADQSIKIYKQGEWLDLCRGPHAPSVSHVGNAFKLLKVAGAYWRGDSNNPMLTRIYGTAFADQAALDAYVTQLEEAEKRDHRRLAKDMDLFHLQQEAHGSVFWHPNGYMIWRQLEAYMRRAIDGAGYCEVKTPQVMNAKQWEASGHWGKYRENMFVIPDEVPNTADDGAIISGKAEWMALKPMNCPAHVLIFKQGIKSYRDLPLRIYENGCCHRNEPHGALHGLMRVRQFTQDDAHIFCREDQIVDEVRSFCELADRIYKDMGFSRYAIKLALRPEQRYGSDEMWDKAENELRNAVEAAGMATAEYGWEELPGEGAFYAPKLEWHLTDAIGRTWQVGTIQSDRVLPERLDATYIGEDGNKHRPVMLHRAIFGSYERFIGILIEHYAGHFPLWLAPVQVMVATITQEADSYAGEVLQALLDAGLRAEADLRNEKINYKVREHSLAKMPVMLIVGKKEAEQGLVSIRRLGSQDQTTMTLVEALDWLKTEARPPC